MDKSCDQKNFTILQCLLLLNKCNYPDKSSTTIEILGQRLKSPSLASSVPVCTFWMEGARGHYGRPCRLMWAPPLFPAGTCNLSVRVRGRNCPTFAATSSGSPTGVVWVSYSLSLQWWKTGSIPLSPRSLSSHSYSAAAASRESNTNRGLQLISPLQLQLHHYAPRSHLVGSVAFQKSLGIQI